MEGLVTSFGLDWKVFFAEVVNFLILIGIIYWVISKYVTPLLEQRRNVIKEGVEKSEKAEQTLADAESEKGRIISEAHSKGSEHIANSVEKGKKREAGIISDAEAQAIVMLENGKNKGEAEKKSIIESSQEEIAKMIVLGAEKVLRAK